MTSKLLRFESFELDLGTAELWKNGQRLRLQDQPARLLVLLARRPGQLVTRLEIQKELWGDDKFVEFEHAINTAVRKIREVVEDNPETPRVIETVPRKGYRFIAEIQSGESAAEVSVAEPPEPLTPSGIVEPPKPFVLPRTPAWILFLITQIGYLVIYCIALYHLPDLETALTDAGFVPVGLTFPFVLITAMCGVAVRLYLLSAVGLRHQDAGRKFNRLFPLLLLLDGVWAASPLLATRAIGWGVALAGVAGMAYLPFSQRTLMLSLYSR